MKTPEAVLTDIERRLRSQWHLELTGGPTAPGSFPRAFALGRPSADELRSDYARIHALTVEWQDWSKRHGLELRYETRVATGGTRQMVPTHVVVEDLDQAAGVVGGQWPARLERGRARLEVLVQRFPAFGRESTEPGRLIRLIDPYSALDFELLLAVSDWYLQHPEHVRGVTPRQVPIPGVHAKWLQRHLPAVAALTGLGDLGLLPAHPARMHFTYLDPTHRRAGGRWHDSATVADSFLPAYLPSVVIISENKDTAIHFPELNGGIAVEGMGRGGRTVASFEWITQAPIIAYWGDIDRDGFEILDGYRRDFGRDLDSILMDRVTYERYERFGTSQDQHGKPLQPGEPRTVAHLRPHELAVYHHVLAPGHDRHRRIEQERIPLSVALEVVQALTRQ